MYLKCLFSSTSYSLASYPCNVIFFVIICISCMVKDDFLSVLLKSSPEMQNNISGQTYLSLHLRTPDILAEQLLVNRTPTSSHLQILLPQSCSRDNLHNNWIRECGTAELRDCGTAGALFDCRSAGLWEHQFYAHLILFFFSTAGVLDCGSTSLAAQPFI